jgi:hypothetical protein
MIASTRVISAAANLVLLNIKMAGLNDLDLLLVGALPEFM